MKAKSRILAGLCLAFAWNLPVLKAQETYQKPPANILKTLNADLPAQPSISPMGDRMILQTPLRYPSIQELAAPYLRLAGVRITPLNRSIHSSPYMTAFSLVDVKNGHQTVIKVPVNARLSNVSWSSDGRQFMFTHDAKTGVELWVGNAETGATRKINGVQLNRILGRPMVWMFDNRTILARVVNPKAGPAPDTTAEISGPSIQQSIGNTTASSTYEVRDVLKSPQDEKLFQYYAESQIALIDVASGRVKLLGKPGLYTRATPSPDGQHILVESLQKPFSYSTIFSRFPTEVDVWNREGRLVSHIASLPLADRIPIRGVANGPRSFQWRDNEPATLVYLEALDGGDSMKNVPHRDRLMMLRSPFKEPAQEVYRAEQRLGGIEWTEQKDLSIIEEYDIVKRRGKTFLVNLDSKPSQARLVWDLSLDDAYRDPGSPIYTSKPGAPALVQVDSGKIYFRGQGASPEGDRPFLDALDTQTLKTERLFQSDKDHLEYFVGWLYNSNKEFITRRESSKDYPNYFVHSLGSKDIRSLTQFPDPLPELRGITKKIVTYKRDDGVDLSFTLYLPSNYQPGTKLPAVFWAYPLDFSDAKVAGQVTGSAQSYVMPGWPLQLFFLQAGYAVIDNPSLPVIGDTKKIYDTYMEQLISGAKAAVDKAVEMGVVDRNRIGAIGHSHGGLMTVNLLAHTDMFRAGIARSGAYNRSLTAFGFQNETRTVWEAPEVYQKVSPFFVADKIKRPLLLIHGADDANPGTITLQSEKMFEAVRGNGGTVRFVRLPFESHGYRARESIEHTVWESLNWFDTYVKNAGQQDLKQASAQAKDSRG